MLWCLLAGYVVNDSSESLSYEEILFTMKARVGYVGPGFAFLSGIVLMIVLTVMFICSMPFVRRSGHFQVSAMTSHHVE